jgi:hypothetical protein
MPGEDPEAVQNKLNNYITEQGADTEAERDALEVSVVNYFRFKRVNRADVAAETRVVNNVQNNFEDRQCLRCADLVTNLAASPAATIIHLRSFTHGISWILGQIDLLEEHLRTSRSFHPSQRVIAIHICGRNPKDLFTDSLVRQWNLDYLSGLHGPGKITAAQAAELLQADRPADMDPGEFERRLAGWLNDLVDIPEGQALLQASLAEARAELLRRYEEVEQREAIDLALAVDAAMVSVNDECMKRLRYRRESERGQQAGMRLFLQLQRTRLMNPGLVGGTSAEPAATAATTPAEGPPAAAPETPAAASETVHRTEAAATQVDGGTRSNDKGPRTPGDLPSDPTQWTPQQVKEFIANQRRKLASEQQRE